MSASSAVPQGYRPPQGQGMQPLNPGGMAPLNPGGMATINPDNRPAGWTTGTAGWASMRPPPQGKGMFNNVAQAIGQRFQNRQPTAVKPPSGSSRLTQALRARAGK